MNYLLVSASTEVFGHLNLVLLFGLIVFGGTFASRLFQKFHIPQVVGCIVVGILLGDGLNLITYQTIEGLRPFTMFALGIIGFMIGGELQAEVFKKHGKQFFIILCSEGIGAFLLVATGSSLVCWFVTGNLLTSIAMGLVLGAISSATAPAATVNVLWEYKTRGPLTATVLAIVALDDALALLLYRAAATSAKALMGIGHNSFFSTTLVLAGEIVGAIALGLLMGLLLCYILRFIRDDDKILEFSLSSLLLVVGFSIFFGIDPILPAMTLGVTMANLAPRLSRKTFDLVGKFSPPIYVSFFVLAGAHLQFNRMMPWIVVMIIVFVLCRATGKMTGAWLGAGYCKAPSVVRKYLGFCLQSQAGVAIGLAILASQQFNANLGHTIIMIVATADFIMEIAGPMLVKFGVKKAGEVGLNITEEDLIKSYTVKDIMDTKPTRIAYDLPLPQILETFSSSENLYYQVVDKNSEIVGIITIAGIKEMFANKDVAAWLLACDVAEPVRDKTTPDELLEDVMEYMQRYSLENIPVVAGKEDNRLVGVLDKAKAMRKISAEVLHRRREADEMSLAVD
ncbi:MAG: cation:proton antiporter domain-containing protein [Planctomycetota bacterium]